MDSLKKKRSHRQKVPEAGQEGWSMNTSASLYPRKKSAIDIYRRSNDSLARKISLLKQASENHTKRKIPTRNQEMLGKHKINDEMRNIDSNAFQKAIDEK